jgi:hypothetical protein
LGRDLLLCSLPFLNELPLLDICNNLLYFSFSSGGLLKNFFIPLGLLGLGLPGLRLNSLFDSINCLLLSTSNFSWYISSLKEFFFLRSAVGFSILYSLFYAVDYEFLHDCKAVGRVDIGDNIYWS